MRKTITIASIAALVGTMGAALAHDDSLNRQASPQPAISVAAMAQKIDALGYDVRRLKADEGVFKARIVERQNGGVVKATFDLATGELVRAEPAY